MVGPLYGRFPRMSESLEDPGPRPAKSKFPSTVPAHLLAGRDKPRWPVYPVVLAVILVIALGGAWIIQKSAEKSASPGSTPAANSKAESAPAAPAATAPGTNDDVKE